ncbi:PST family polysaccharide transporter [Nakamurella sp. UYEF19]|uniref:lipopolysaccharide biosynthesis protein n=1 Tax=Nakamurella sp. UYEF19 TaxID=1756392 RepID=UPI003398FEF3
MTLGDRAAKATSITLAVQAMRTVVQFVSTILLARLLLPDDFGLVAMVTSVVGIAELIRDFGLSMAAVQAKEVTSEQQDNLFWLNLALGTGCACLAAAATPLIVAAYGEPRIEPLIPVFAGLFVVSGFNTQFRAHLVRHMRFKAIGFGDLTAQILSVVLALILALLGAGMWAVAAQQIAFTTVTCAFNVINSKWWPGRWHRGVPLREFLRFGASLAGTQIIAFLVRNVDNIGIGVVWGATATGIYNRAYQLMTMPLAQIQAPMTQVAVPVLSRVQDDKATLLRYAMKAQLVACYITTTVFAVAAGLAGPLVLLLLGPNWGAVVPIFLVLALSGVFRALAQVAYWIYLAVGASGALLRQRAVTGSFTVAAILAGLPWGPIGVACTGTVANLVVWLVGVWHCGRATGLRTTPLTTNALRIVAAIGAPCGLLSWAGSLLPVGPLLQIVVGLALVCVYLFVAYRFIPSVRLDVQQVTAIVRRSLPDRFQRRGRHSRTKGVASA